mmetsp:Transcript_30436/g.88992  ORF Transcript_30436/g.88992 Transcript_30436/m.88992 type:complete len:302 (+) Transcript_30436:81-986(+)
MHCKSIVQMKPLILVISTIVATCHSWSDIDTATLHSWSPIKECTQANYDEGKTCDRSEFIGDIDATLDNTGVTCYSNPDRTLQNGWFAWLGPNPNAGPNEPDVYAYSLYVPEGEPVPQCDNHGVCDPCDALNPIRGNTAMEWANMNYSLLVELGYSSVLGVSQYESGCGTRFFGGANEVHPTNVCGPFQGNITVEYGDPGDLFSCTNRNIATAEKCGAECDNGPGDVLLERAVFVNNEDGEPACCVCKYYNEVGTAGVCGGADVMHLCYENMDASDGNLFIGVTFLHVSSFGVVLSMMLIH